MKYLSELAVVLAAENDLWLCAAILCWAVRAILFVNIGLFSVDFVSVDYSSVLFIFD